jgi:hypothetical protein
MFCLRTFCLYGCFVPTDVLSLRTFCPYGCLVPTDVLSLWTFCPTDVLSPAVLSPDVLSPDVLSLRTFCLRMFCLGTIQGGVLYTAQNSMDPIVRKGLKLLPQRCYRHCNVLFLFPLVHLDTKSQRHICV